MSVDNIKAQAEAITRMSNFETSYIAGEWWTNRFMAVKLTESAPSPLVFSMECQCITGGCDCDCIACLNCEEQSEGCQILRACPTLVAQWTPETTSIGTKPIHDRITALLESLNGAETEVISVTPKLNMNSLALRCVLVDGACEGIHAQANFLGVARRFGQVDAWRITRQAGEPGDALMLLGYRQEVLTAIVMPIARMAPCKREAA